MLTQALVLSAILFAVGTFGVLARRNAIIMFLCIELQLNAVNLALVAFSRAVGIDGQVFVFFVMTAQLFAQTFSANSTLDDSGDIPATDTPCMEYASPIWGGSTHTALLDRVESKDLRLIGCPHLTNCLLLLKSR